MGLGPGKRLLAMQIGHFACKGRRHPAVCVCVSVTRSIRLKVCHCHFPAGQNTLGMHVSGFVFLNWQLYHCCKTLSKNESAVLNNLL